MARAGDVLRSHRANVSKHILEVSVGEQVSVDSGLSISATRGAGLRFKLYILMIFTMAAVVWGDLADGVLFYGDIDDKLRGIEIKQFLAGKGWYDLVISGIATPQAYISPWSRLVDAPYAILATVFSHLMTLDMALTVAEKIWPPVMLLGFAWFSLITLIRLMPAGDRPHGLDVIVTALTMLYAILEFCPGRIDHHNVQLLMLSAALAGVTLWSLWGSVLTALAVVLSMTVGLETAPLLAVLWAGLGLAWICGVPGSKPVFCAFSFSIAGFAPVITLIFAGPDVLFHVENDVFSAPYVAIFTGFGLISGLLTLFVGMQTSVWTRLFSLALPNLLFLAGVIYLMPGVLAGPYSIIDPLSRALWLDHVSQEHSLVYLMAASSSVLVNTAIEVSIAMFALVYVVDQAREGRAAAAIVFSVGLIALIAVIDVQRFIKFPAAILPLFIPALVGVLRHMPLARQKIWFGCLVGSIVASCAAFYVASRVMPVVPGTDALDAADYIMVNTCTKDDLHALRALPKGRYMVPSGMALAVVESAPDGISVSNISYHRASPGIKRMFETFLLTDPEGRKSAMQPFDYLAFCSYPDTIRRKIEAPLGSLFEALLDHRDWPGLEPIAVHGDDNLKVFRVNHQLFQ
jgi:hypothetical protein